jgi:hypothetical protein
MGRDVSHEDIRELLGAYALDAIDADERRTVDLHLIGCSSCRSEVKGHREAATLLSPGAATPPSNAWDRIEAALVESPPKLNLDRIGPRFVSLRMAAAAAIGVLIVIGLLAVNAVQQDRRLDEATSALAEESLTRSALAASAHPQAERLVLASADESSSADLVLLPDGTGYVIRHNLEPLSADRTYQLWALVGESAISIGVIGNRPAVVAFHIDGEVAGFAITNETAGGVASTRNVPVVAGYRKG